MLQLLLLRTIGILLPIYIMVKAFITIQRRRHHQVGNTLTTINVFGKSVNLDKLVKIAFIILLKLLTLAFFNVTLTP